MRKFINLMLLLLVLSAASVNAQVTIGADAPPHSSAVLDLQSDNLGFKLPTIELGDVAVFQLSGTEDEADGIMIYNSSDETIGGSGKGIYVWEGKWVYAGKSAPVDVPVTRIDITSANNVKVVSPLGDGLQLTATVTPTNASNKTLRWTIVYNPSSTAGYATIDQDGLITGVKPGIVTARASATDDFGAYRDFQFSVQPTGYAESVTVRSENGITYMSAGTALQLVADVEPITSYQGVIWSVDEGSSTFASISTSGLLLGLAPGLATVIATPAAGSGDAGNIQIEVNALVAAPTTTVEMDGIEYESYVFGATTWFVNNSQAGNWMYDRYDNDPEKLNMYYSRSNAPTACLDPWSLPTREQTNELMVFLDTEATDEEWALWVNELVGRANNNAWAGWGSQSSVWTDDTSGTARGRMNWGYARNLQYEVLDQNYYYSVRCVK
jgi:hypothetical protein